MIECSNPISLAKRVQAPECPGSINIKALKGQSPLCPGSLQTK